MYNILHFNLIPTLAFDKPICSWHLLEPLRLLYRPAGKAIFNTANYNDTSALKKVDKPRHVFSMKMPWLFSFLNARIWAKIAKQKKVAYKIRAFAILINPFGIQGYSRNTFGPDSFLFFTQLRPMLTKTKKADSKTSSPLSYQK